MQAITEDGETVVIKTIVAPFFRTGWNYDRDSASAENALYCPEESLADQSQAEEADINTIVKRFGLTGQLPSNVKVPTYADLTAVPSFSDAMQLIVEARESFMQLPADVRSRFGNDVGAFVDYVSNPENVEEARKMGLAMPEKKEEPVIPMKVEVVNPAIAQK